MGRRKPGKPRPAPPPANLVPGRVVARFGARLIVEDEKGRLHRCTSRRKLGDLVCGDNVQWHTDERGDCIVQVREPRRSELARPDSHGRKKVIAANIDQILIVTSPRPAFSPGLVDRYLVAAEVLGIEPVIVLNKIDLLDTAARGELDPLLDEYRRLGYAVIETSVKNGEGIADLETRLQEHTSIFVGQSGVGKSSLINALLPDAEARIGEISEATGKGTHTTTTAWLYHLPHDHGAVIDSPGIREFGLWNIEPHQVAAGFREFREYAPACRFRDCLHRKEPGCAVREAVEEGRISRRRYESYLRILASVENPDL